MHIESISNGLGAQSMYMLILCAEEKIPAKLSITADTGWENDRLWSDGTRSTSKQYFEQVVLPYAKKYGIEAVMVEALDGSGNPLPPLGEWTKNLIELNQLTHLKIPLFGSNGGRLKQQCTSRKKVNAIRQELRRRGAVTARSAHGLHRGELHRMKGRDGRVEHGYYTLTDMDVLWCSHYYPLIDLGLFRTDAQNELIKRNIPYLVSTECDGCPHKDWARWSRTSESVINELAETEAKMNGEFFFTDKRIPLKEALLQMKQEDELKKSFTPNMFDDVDFGCDEGGVCGV